MSSPSSSLATIELDKEYLKFSAAHFTIFSATERERLHGHNFGVAATLTAPVDENGLCFSYGIFKAKLKRLCDELDEFLILPLLSPHLNISDEGEFYAVQFNDEFMRFLKSDTRVLPLRNVTIEELARYLLDRLLSDDAVEEISSIQRASVRVCSGPGQSASCSWSR